MSASALHHLLTEAVTQQKVLLKQQQQQGMAKALGQGLGSMSAGDQGTGLVQGPGQGLGQGLGGGVGVVGGTVEQRSNRVISAAITAACELLACASLLAGTAPPLAHPIYMNPHMT